MNVFFCLCAFVALISIIEGKSSNVVEISFVENQHSALRNSYLKSECLDSKQKKEERNKCRVCGVEDYVTNEVNSTSFGCNNENRNIQFFNDPIVQGDILTQAKISVTGVFCGATVHFGINNQLIGTYYPTKENCKTCEEGSCVPASTIEFSSKHFDLIEGGFPTYFYGVSNKFWTQVESGNVKLVSASIELLSEEQPSLASRQVCPSVRPIAGGFRQEDFCYASSNNMSVLPNCFYFDALFNNWNQIRLNRIKVQTIQCTNKNRDFCHEVETQDYQFNTTVSLPYACFQSWSCNGIAPHQPCVRYYDISLVAKNGGCSPFTYTIAVTNPDINIKKFKCKLETMKIGAPLTTGVTTGITTALTTGVTTGAVTTGPVTTGDISTGDISTGDISTGDISTGDITTGDITTGPVTTGDISTGPVTTGDITTGVTSCSIQPYTANNKLDIVKTGGSAGTLGVFKNAARVMQLLVLANEGPATARKLIGVVFKRHEATGSQPLLTSTKFDITISKPANGITTLTQNSVFTNNEATPVVVRSGPISIPADTFATQNTYPDSYYICFDTPVTIQGSFIIRINHGGFPSDFAVIAAPHGNKALLSIGAPFTTGTNTVSFPSMRFIYEEELP